MGMYGTKYSGGCGDVVSESALSEEFSNEAVQGFIQDCIYEELSMLPDERKKEFVVSNEAQQMIDEGLITTQSLVGLSRSDDLSRRIKLASQNIARSKGDQLWDKWQFHMAKAKEYEEKMATKYQMQSAKLGKLGQKSYLKTHKISPVFMRK